MAAKYRILTPFSTGNSHLRAAEGDWSESYPQKAIFSTENIHLWLFYGHFGTVNLHLSVPNPYT